MGDQPRYVVTLVHGTWAPNARWARPGSSLRTTLASALDGGIRFRRLCWTGRNRHRDRSDAASRTRVALNRGLKANPGACHFVIAHSHGGNIVRAALQDAALQPRIAGVVTMGTPFIACRRRETSLHLTVLALMVAVLAGYAAAALGAQLVLRFPGAATIDDSPVLAGLAGLLALVSWVGGSYWVYWRLRPRLSQWATLVARRTAARLVGTTPMSTPFLCVGLEGDEANLGLGAAGWLADAPFRAAARIGALVERVWPRVLKIAWILGIPLSLAGFADQRFAVLLLAAAVLLAIPALTWPFMLLVPRVPWVAFGVGRERLADSVFSHVFSTRTPPLCRNCTVKYFDTRDVLAMGRWRALITGTLFHSSVYSVAPVSAYIASWLREHSAAASGSKAELFSEGHGA